MAKEAKEMQSLGLLGIYKESYNTILSHKNIFTKITLSLILPLSFISLLYTQFSTTFTTDISLLAAQLAQAVPGTDQYQEISHKILSEGITSILFSLAYLAVHYAFSLLSTSALVYTVAVFHTARDDGSLTLKKVTSVVPKVWKRLMVTLLSTFAAFFTYTVAAIVFTGIIARTTLLFDRSGKLSLYVIIGLMVVYVIGSVYLAVVWELATVVSVLEESYGFGALRKSRELIKGNTWLAVRVTFSLASLSALMNLLLKTVAGVVGDGLVGTAFYWVAFLLWVSVMLLFGNVMRTVLYFVCKSYHTESIDKSALWDRLQVYPGGGQSQPLITPKDVSQLV